MIGGAGDDTYFADNAADVVTEAVGQGTDTVWASVNYTLGAGSEIENLNVNVGTGLTLTGNEFANTITGGVGSDTLNGGAGNDTVVVNAGDAAGGETYNGGANSDTLEIDGTSNFTGSSLLSIENLTFVTTGTSTATFTSSLPILRPRANLPLKRSRAT